MFFRSVKKYSKGKIIWNIYLQFHNFDKKRFNPLDNLSQYFPEDLTELPFKPEL